MILLCEHRKKQSSQTDECGEDVYCQECLLHVFFSLYKAKCFVFSAFLADLLMPEAMFPSYKQHR